MSFFFWVIMVTLLSGCVVPVPGKDRSSHYVIIGFGIVSVNEATEKAVIATDTHALGLSLSDRPGLKFGVGYSSSTVVTVAPGARDVRVEVSKKPWGPLIVETQRAAMQQDETTERGEHEQQSR